jgi:hypothetical protein
MRPPKHVFGEGIMDGSTIVIPSATRPSGLMREDALFRIVYFGEALRAITEHVNDTLISGACGPMIEMLDDAFDRMSETRDTFGPEEFTLFVMSRMLSRCETPDAAREFQVGAASYILKSADALPDAYKPVILDARRMLGKPTDPEAPAQVTSAEAPDAPADTAPAQPRSAYTHRTAPHQRAIDTPPPARPEPPVARPASAPGSGPGTRPAATRNLEQDPQYLRRRDKSVLRKTWRRITRILG